MNASFLQAPSQATLNQVTTVLESGKVTDGPIFVFDAARSLLVFVHVGHGLVEHWRVEHCPNVEQYRARVCQYLDAALHLSADLGVAFGPSGDSQARH